jgi:Protein of unknown function (DUF3108)
VSLVPRSFSETLTIWMYSLRGHRFGLVLLLVLLCQPVEPFQSQTAAPVPAGAPPSSENLQYSLEWRLITAGKARLSWTATAGQGYQANLQLESTGLVSKLFKVNDDYSSGLDAGLCAHSSFLKTNEGSRHRETRITFDAERRKASYLERDTTKNSVLASSEIEIPLCVCDIIGALYRMRTLEMEPGQAGQIPVSDGKKSAMARVEAQQRELVKTAAGAFKTIRYEAFLFNNVIYRRSGRVFVWLTDDARRLPVQIQVRLQFHIGTITLLLEKEGT